MKDFLKTVVKGAINLWPLWLTLTVFGSLYAGLLYIALTYHTPLPFIIPIVLVIIFACYMSGLEQDEEEEKLPGEDAIVDVHVTVNGQQHHFHEMGHLVLSYDNLAACAGISPSSNPSITYRHKTDKSWSGSLLAGQSVIIPKPTSEAIFNVLVTGNA